MKTYQYNKLSQALILAAGYGERMQPLTLKTPKPLIKLLKKPLISYILDQLIMNNIRYCFINSHYLYEKINNYAEKFQKLNNYPIISVAYEKNILDTGGAIKNIDKIIFEEPLLVINGDSILIQTKTLNPLERLIHYFNPQLMDALLLLDSFEDSVGYNGNGDFVLKQKALPTTINRNLNTSAKAFAFTGWQILNPKVVKNINLDKFSLNFFYDKAINKGRLWGIINQDKWLHIGTLEALKESEQWLIKVKQ